jgi:hypothetical protein
MEMFSLIFISDFLSSSFSSDFTASRLLQDRKSFINNFKRSGEGELEWAEL